MSEIEQQLLQALLQLEKAAESMPVANPKPDLRPLFARVDELAGRLPEENLRAWFSRRSNDELRADLAGEVLDAVERDLPSARVPHAVAD